MKQIKILLLVSMAMLFTACGGGGSSSDSTVPVNTESTKTIAIDKIKVYADDKTQPIPSIQDYVDAGVVDVTVENINDVNSIVAGLTASDVDTTEEIQKIVDELGVNILPTANAGPDKSIEVNQAVTITGSGSDIDGMIVSYEWKKNTTVIATTASFNYTPASVGTDILTFTVMDDDGATASDSMSVIATTTPPPVDTIKPVITILGNNPVTVTHGTVYSDSGATAVDNIDGTLTVTKTGSVDTSKLGTYSVTYTATDTAGNTATATRTVSVEPIPNTAPVADAGDTQNVYVDDTVQLNGSGSSDNDNDTLTYSWSFTSKPQGSKTTLSNTTIANPTFIPDIEGSYVLSLIVNDSKIDSTVDTVSITAITNIVPTITSAAAVSIEENKINIKTVTASDSNGDTLTFSIAGGDDGSMFNIDSSSGLLTFNHTTDFESPSDSNDDNIFNVIVQVSDGRLNNQIAMSITLNNLQKLQFQKEVLTTDTANSSIVRVANIDNDQDNDIVAYNPLITTLFWLENIGKAGFIEHVISTTDNSGAKELYIDDFNNDGYIDIKTLSMLYSNDGEQNFTPTALPSSDVSVIYADVNNDEYMDIIDERLMIQTSTSASNMCGGIVDVNYKQNNGDNTYSYIPYTRAIRDSAGRSIHAIDMDNDTDKDIVYSMFRSQCAYFGWSENIGSDIFNDHRIESGKYMMSLDPTDIDKDNDIDIVISGFDNGLQIYVNNGSQSFSIETIDTNTSIQASTVADLNNDGMYDIISTTSEKSIFIYTNTGDIN